MPAISVLIVDDSSNDGTAEFLAAAKHPNLHTLYRKSNLGYGKACADGFKWVFNKPFKYLITMDADFSHNYRAVPSLAENLSSNDVAIGSRYVAGGKIENWSWHRRILSKAANLYVRSVLKIKVKDMTTGFNAYRSDALSKIDLEQIKSDGYAFLVELKYRLIKTGARVMEHPITFSERREGQSKMSRKIIWESVKLPWKLLNS